MSLFRYPGGKQKLLKQLLPKAEQLGLYTSANYMEPFLGGGSVGLSILQNPKAQFDNVWLNDVDYGLYAVWVAVRDHMDELINRIESYEPHVSDFVKFKSLLVTAGCEVLVDVAFCKIAIHQISYSGLGCKAGSAIGGKEQNNRDGTAKTYQVGCRWNPVSLVKKVRKLNHILQDVHIMCFDWAVCLSNAPDDSFIYLDPPYYEQGKSLYLNSFDLLQHEKLAAFLRTAKFKWLLSYDDQPEIRQLYSWAKIENISATYTINTNALAHRKLELTISG